ncbi:cilia-and flagella-associated protein 96 [Ptiloglossa arizonensis]|uniref:cilia-and flagella-associated protein 96 n=1 Tax=Ptiloglossa arizonensis TaxID=3350558 RepID=UPI003FA1681C
MSATVASTLLPRHGESICIKVSYQKSVIYPGSQPDTSTVSQLERERAKIGPTMIPPSPAKKHATPGDWHGCFEKVTYFNPEKRPEPKAARELPNLMTKPNPLGGPGYTDICINPFPLHMHDPYDPERTKGSPVLCKNIPTETETWMNRLVCCIQNEMNRPSRSPWRSSPPTILFSLRPVDRFLYASAPLDHFPPNPYKDDNPGPTYVRPHEIEPKMMGPGRIYVPFPKKPGGNHSGCFDKFPTYSSDPYEKDTKQKKVEGWFILGGPPLRTKYTTSIINQVTRTSCNSTNYMRYQPRVYSLRTVKCKK